MNYDAIFSQFEGSTVRAALVGAGQFGTSLLGQVERTAMLDVPVVCDLDVERAKASFLAAGYAEDDIVIAESASASVTALESGKRVALADASLIENFRSISLSKRPGTRRPQPRSDWRRFRRASISRWSARRRIL